MLLQPLEGDKLLQNNRQNIDDKAHFLFFYRSVSAHPCLGIFGSFGSLESGRKSLFSTATLFITQDLDDVVLLLLQSRKHSRTQTHARTHARTHAPTHPYTPYDRQNLPFRTKPAQYSHTNILYVSMWTSHVCGNSPCISPGLNQPDHLTLYSSS